MRFCVYVSAIGHLGTTSGPLWHHIEVTWGSFRYYFGFMTVALGYCLVTFDVENEVDVHKWWLGGAEN